MLQRTAESASALLVTAELRAPGRLLTFHEINKGSQRAWHQVSAGEVEVIGLQGRGAVFKHFHQLPVFEPWQGLFFNQADDAAVVQGGVEQELRVVQYQVELGVDRVFFGAVDEGPWEQGTGG